METKKAIEFPTEEEKKWNEDQMSASDVYAKSMIELYDIKDTSDVMSIESGEFITMIHGAFAAGANWAIDADESLEYIKNNIIKS